MKVHNGKETIAKFYGTRVISATYHGMRLIWQAVSSCFGAGFWSNSRPWKNGDNWKNS